ncbi:MAG: hypothetical protein U1E83_11745 [Methylotetracoccus sp.]
MRSTLLVATLLFLSGCASAPHQQMAASGSSSNPRAMSSENDKLCENHKQDYRYFLSRFSQEHAQVCSGDCAYTQSMNKNSDTMERVAGLYYLMNCDYNHGRL